MIATRRIDPMSRWPTLADRQYPAPADAFVARMARGRRTGLGCCAVDLGEQMVNNQMASE